MHPQEIQGATCAAAPRYQASRNRAALSRPASRLRSRKPRQACIFYVIRRRVSLEPLASHACMRRLQYGDTHDDRPPQSAERAQRNANCSSARDTQYGWRHSMTDKNTLHDAFLDELRDMYHAEKQLTNALPKLARKAKSPDLTDAFQSHLAETENHVTRLEQVFEELGETAKAKTCDGMKGIIDEANQMMGESYDDQTMDAVLIASAHRGERYEIGAQRAPRECA